MPDGTISVHQEAFSRAMGICWDRNGLWLASKVQLWRLENILRPGEARAYLPGDIHDTRCLSDQALVFRFTERDLKREDQVEGRATGQLSWRVRAPECCADVSSS